MRIRRDGVDYWVPVWDNPYISKRGKASDSYDNTINEYDYDEASADRVEREKWAGFRRDLRRISRRGSFIE